MNMLCDASDGALGWPGKGIFSSSSLSESMLNPLNLLLGAALCRGRGGLYGGGGVSSITDIRSGSSMSIAVFVAFAGWF